MFQKIENMDNFFYVGGMGAFGISIAASIANMIVDKYINELKLNKNYLMKIV